MLVDDIKHDTNDKLWNENDEHRDHSNIYLFIKFDVAFLSFYSIQNVHSIENYIRLDTHTNGHGGGH